MATSDGHMRHLGAAFRYSIRIVALTADNVRSRGAPVAAAMRLTAAFSSRRPLLLLVPASCLSLSSDGGVAPELMCLTGGGSAPPYLSKESGGYNYRDVSHPSHEE